MINDAIELEKELGEKCYTSWSLVTSNKDNPQR
jgi:hypothetical protein